ncbi:MAG TPA: ECF-type sigma factor [Polyangiaceae bacterium]|nr:ECF-type sigma factor [Polyangiaceae bacterium]
MRKNEDGRTRLGYGLVSVVRRPSTSKDWVASNEVRRAIDRCLRGVGVRRQELADLRQEVVADLLASNENPPTGDRREALAVVITQRRFVDGLRKEGRRREESEDARAVEGHADGFAPRPYWSDPTELLMLRDQLRVLVRFGRLSERELSMLAAKAAGFSDEEVGARFGCTKRTVANVCCMARRTLRAA